MNESYADFLYHSVLNMPASDQTPVLNRYWMFVIERLNDLYYGEVV